DEKLRKRWDISLKSIEIHTDRLLRSITKNHI
ncbi:hypothetical protein DBR06_SOUSAS8610110, partial [Sousa chinensis]